MATPEKIKKEMDGLFAWGQKERDDCHPVEFAARLHKRFVFIHPFRDDGVIIGTRLEKPSKINGFALLSPNFFMPERENGITSLLHILLASSMKV